MIRYTEDAAEADLKSSLLANVRVNHKEKSSSAINSSTATGEKRRISVKRLQSEKLSLDDGDGSQFDLVHQPLLIETSVSSVIKEVNVNQVRNEVTTDNSKRIITRHRVTSVSASTVSTLSQPPIILPMSTSIKTRNSITKTGPKARAPLPIKRVGRAQPKPDDLEDFPLAASSSSLPTSSQSINATKRTKVTPRFSSGLSVSKAPTSTSRFQNSTSRNESSQSPNNPQPSRPLSETLSRVVKNHKSEQFHALEKSETVEPIDDLLVHPASSESEQIDQDQSLFGTPPRSGTAPMPTGSSTRRRSLLETGSNAGRLLSLYRNARSREGQNLSDFAFHENKLDAQEKMVLKVVAFDNRSSEHCIVTCHVLEKCNESSLITGDLVSCIIPFFPFDTRDAKEQHAHTVLRNLGHMSPNQDLGNCIIRVYRPWRVIRYDDVSNSKSIICSGLVTVEPISTTTTPTIPS